MIRVLDFRAQCFMFVITTHGDWRQWLVDISPVERKISENEGDSQGEMITVQRRSEICSRAHYQIFVDPLYQGGWGLDFLAPQVCAHAAFIAI